MSACNQSRRGVMASERDGKKKKKNYNDIDGGRDGFLLFRLNSTTPYTYVCLCVNAPVQCSRRGGGEGWAEQIGTIRSRWVGEGKYTENIPNREKINGRAAVQLFATNGTTGTHTRRRLLIVIG